MIIMAFTVRASEEDLQIAHACLSLLENPYSIYNIPQNKPDNHLISSSIVITFGSQAANNIQTCIKEKNLENIKTVNLPAIKFLTQRQENIQSRQETFNQLIQFKTTIIELENTISTTSNLEISIEDLPNIKKEELLLVKKSMKNDNYHFELSKSGKTIKIGNKIDLESPADINITFEELYHIKNITDTLKVSEIKLVRKKVEKDK